MDVRRPPARARTILVRNLAGLYAVRLSAILPIVYIPYVVRILGPAGYGVFAFAQSLVSYFGMLIDYGFNLAGARRVAAHREDRLRRDRVVSAMLSAKLILTGAGFLVLLALVVLVPPIGSVRHVVLPMYCQVVGNALFPEWLYQGEERMLPSSTLMVGGSLLATIGVFFVVNEPGDYVALAWLWGLSTLGVGSVSLLVALRLFRVRLNAPTRQEIAETLRDGALLSLSAGSTTLYTSGNAFILGLVAPREVVGIYSGAEKMVRAVQALVAPLQQALYPRASRLAGESTDLAVRAARRVVVVAAALGLTLSAALFLAAPLLVRVVLGPDFERAIAVMRVLSPLPLLVALSSSLIFQLMLPLGRDAALLRLITFAGITNVILALVLAPRLLEVGMALAVLTAELLIVMTMAAYLRDTGVHLLRGSRRDTTLKPLGAAADE
jgi:polysaccharide transporter, PST family